MIEENLLDFLIGAVYLLDSVLVHYFIGGSYHSKKFFSKKQKEYLATG